MRTRRLPSELVVAILVAVVGVIDAVIGDAADLAVLFGAVALLCAMSLLRAVPGRRSVSLRDDVARWLEVTSSEQGETPGDLADRAISAYRAGLVHDPRDPSTPVAASQETAT